MALILSSQYVFYGYVHNRELGNVIDVVSLNVTLLKLLP